MYGAPVPVYGVRTGKPPSASTAETLILIAFIFQAIVSIIFLIPLGVVALIAATGVVFFGFGFIFAIIYIALGAVDVLLLYVGYAYSYSATRNGQYEAARSPTLVLGILGLFLGFIIVGVLYLVAYVKLGDAVNEMRQPVYGYPGPGYYPGPVPGAAPGYAPPQTPLQGSNPTSPGAAAVPTGPACPRCGRPSVWVAQYSRYFCTTDQQYL